MRSKKKSLFLHYLSLLDRSNGRKFQSELREHLSMPNEHCIQRILTQQHQMHFQNYDLSHMFIYDMITRVTRICYDLYSISYTSATVYHMDERSYVVAILT